MGQTKTILDRKILNNLRMLQTPGDPDVLGQILEMFQAAAPSTLDKIRDAIAQSDFQSLYKSAHTLKGNSASVGASALAAQSKELEIMGRMENVQGAEERLAQVVKEYQRAIRAMKRECGKS